MFFSVLFFSICLTPKYIARSSIIQNGRLVFITLTSVFGTNYITPISSSSFSTTFCQLYYRHLPTQHFSFNLYTTVHNMHWHSLSVIIYTTISSCYKCTALMVYKFHCFMVCIPCLKRYVSIKRWI